MNSQDLLNIITISISTILSIGAILLSIWFYRESSKQNKETALMHTSIKNAIEKLEHLYDRTYTDTFGALKTQMDAMQKHIFNSSVGHTNASEPDQLRLFVLGCITDKATLSIDDLCKAVTGYNKVDIQNTVYTFHREGIIDFDGQTIKHTKNIIGNNIDGQSGSV